MLNKFKIKATENSYSLDKIQEVKDRVGRIVAERGLSYNSISLKLGRNPTYLQKFVPETSK